ncbi:hypothetical protein Tco_0173318 [Tanacetum coccineum]
MNSSNPNCSSQVIPQVALSNHLNSYTTYTESTVFVDSCFVIPVFSPGDDPIACLSKAMAFLTAVASSRFPSTNNQLRTSSNPRNQATIHKTGKWLQCNKFRGDKGKIILVLCIRAMLQAQGEILQVDRQELLNATTAKKLTLKEQVDSLEQNLSKQIKEKEYVLQTFVVFKNESNEKENKYMENDIDLEKKIKELDNIICKVGQSVQTVHMLTKPQAFYDNIHKQALGYQNSFYLKKAQHIKPTLYDGVVMSNAHVAMHVIDDEETLILEEESRSKMYEKAKDPEVIAKKISHKPIDYEKLNRLTKDFRKRFSPQQELSAEQAFWFHILNPTIEPPYTPPVIVDVPSELPKVSLVNASLKKLKFHLTQFDSVVKKRTTPNALEEEVQTVFDQMEVVVQQSSVDKQCLEIAKKEILLENDRLL